MQKQHDTQIHNFKEMHRQELDMKEKSTVTARQNHRQGFQVVPDVQENTTHGKALRHTWVLKGNDRKTCSQERGNEMQR